jgi:hypothetical protein
MLLLKSQSPAVMLLCFQTARELFSMEADDRVLTQPTPEEEEEEYEPRQVLESVSSIVWEFMTFKGIKGKGVDKSRVYCKLCKGKKTKGKKEGIPYSGGTSNLTTHLTNNHHNELKEKEAEGKKVNKNEKKEEPSVKSFFSADKKKVYKWPKTSPKWKEKTMMIAKWFAKDSRSSLMVEDEGFRRLMEMVCPEYDVPSANTITKYVQILYEETKAKIKKELEDPDDIVLTSDGGTSSNAVSFQTTNAHMINKNLELKTYCLGVRENKEKHTADNYSAKTDEITEEFGIKKKVFMNTTDNEKKMQKAFGKKRNGCMAHIIHITVTKGCQVKEVDDVLKKIRMVSKLHNKSYSFRYQLEEEQKVMGIKVKPLQQDVPTRWGSTRSSTASFLDSEEDGDEEEDSVFGELEVFKNAQAINNALNKITWKKKAKKRLYLLSTSDMLIIKNINMFLTKIDIYTTTLGGSKFVSASVVLPVVKSFKKLLQPDDEDVIYIAEMKTVMLEDFRERIKENLNMEVLVKATALDFRFNKMKVMESKEAREKVFDLLLEEMKDNKKKDGKKKAVEIPSQAKKDSAEKNRKLCLDFDESDDDAHQDEDDELKREVRFGEMTLVSYS